jgi:hypothetical protein
LRGVPPRPATTIARPDEAGVGAAIGDVGFAGRPRSSGAALTWPECVDEIHGCAGVPVAAVPADGIARSATGPSPARAPTHLMLILAIALLVVGPKGLPETGPLVPVCAAERLAPHAPAGRWSA